MGAKYEFRVVDISKDGWLDQFTQFGTEGFRIVASLRGGYLSTTKSSGFLFLEREV